MHRSLFGLMIFASLVSRTVLADGSTNAVDEIRELRARIEALEETSGEHAHEEHAEPAEHGEGAHMDVSFDVVVNAGWASTEEVETLQPGGHDPSQRGFSVPNAELALDGGVDRYWEGVASIVLLTDADDETEVELEEAYARSTGLPHGLQVKAGRYFVEFGRQNNQHPHAWSFVDQPLVMNRLLGADGLKQNGGQVSWRVPTANHTAVMLGVLNGQGEGASSYRFAGEEDADGVSRVYGRATTDGNLDDAGDLLYAPRIATSFELAEAQTLALGISAGLGANATGDDTETRIYGGDVLWTWTSPRGEGGWPFVTWLTEVMARDFEAGADAAAGLPAETLHDWGFYSQVQWGFARRWATGLRGEYVTGDSSASADVDAERGTQKRVSPNVTWHCSASSKLRLQYNHSWLEAAEDGDAIWLQLEFLLGAHAAHE